MIHLKFLLKISLLINNIRDSQKQIINWIILGYFSISRDVSILNLL